MLSSANAGQRPRRQCARLLAAFLAGMLLAASVFFGGVVSLRGSRVPSAPVFLGPSPPPVRNLGGSAAGGGEEGRSGGRTPYRGGERPFVVSIVAIWDEALILPLSLDSTRHFVDEYVVVHKPGKDATYDVLQECIAAWGLRVKYFASDMTLREARMFAINLTMDYADVWVIQDGDEVFYSSGPTAAQNSLPLLFGAGFNAVRSKMVYIKHTLTTTVKDRYKPMAPERWGGHVANGIMLIDHPTFLRNDGPGSVFMPDPLELDVPEPRGPSVTLHQPWKFDVSIKHPLRELLRASFLGWSRAGSPGRIEDWAEVHDTFHKSAVATNRSSSLEESAELYVKEVLPGHLQPYSEKEWHEYPEAIRKYVQAGRIRGYDHREGPLL